MAKDARMETACHVGTLSSGNCLASPWLRGRRSASCPASGACGRASRRLRQGKDDALWASNLGGGAKATMLGAKARLLADPA